MMDMKEHIVSRALAEVEETLTKKVMKDTVSGQLRADTIPRIEMTTNVFDAKSAHLVIEAMPGVLELKVGAFGTA